MVNSLRVHGEEVSAVSNINEVSELCPLLFILYFSDLYMILENTLLSYAGDLKLLTEFPKPEKQKSVYSIIA